MLKRNLNRSFLILFSVLCYELNAEVRVVQGVQISASTHPETVLVTLSSGFCSGVFVAAHPPTLLTAGHCVGGEPELHKTEGYLKYKGVPSHRICTKKGANVLAGRNDVSLVVFKEGSVQVPGLATLSYGSFTIGTPVVLVGYGANELRSTPTPIKRLGKNRIHSFIKGSFYEDGMIKLVGTNFSGDVSENALNLDPHSLSASGDSGGPLFLDDATGTHCIGTVSGGDDNGSNLAWTHYTNFSSPEMQDFLKAALDPAFLKELEKDSLPSNYTSICGVRK